MQGGLHPELKIEWYEDLLSSIKKRFNVHLPDRDEPAGLLRAEMDGGAPVYFVESERFFARDAKNTRNACLYWVGCF